jgi:Transposase IS116/IS110/IS902 family
MSLTRKRAERLAHLQHTNRQDTLPEIGTKLAYNANRAGVAARCPDPAVQPSMAVDLALLGSDAPRLNALAWHLVKAATPHDAKTLDLRQTGPGLGNILSLVLLDELHDLQPFPSGQAFVAYGRLVTCAQASAGKRDGTAGATMGHASLQGAFSAAAVLFLRDHPAGQKSRTSFEKTHGPGNALTLRAQQRGRAVYDMLQRQQAGDVPPCLHDS